MNKVLRADSLVKKQKGMELGQTPHLQCAITRALGGKQGAIHPHSPRTLTNVPFPFRRGSGELQSNSAPKHHKTAGRLLMLADVFAEEKVCSLSIRLPLGDQRGLGPRDRWRR